MNCIVCGKEIDEEDLFCKYCGTNLSVRQPKEQPEEVAKQEKGELKEQESYAVERTLDLKESTFVKPYRVKKI